MAVAQDKKASELTAPVSIADTDVFAGYRPGTGGEPNLDIRATAGLIRSTTAGEAGANSLSRVMTPSDRPNLFDWISDTPHNSIIAGTNTNDLSAQIQAAFDSNEGLRASRGTYYASGLVLGNLAHLKGAGRGKTIFRPASTGHAAVFGLATGDVQGIHLSDFSLTGDGVTNQSAMKFVAVQDANDGGLWRSTFARIHIRGFVGHNIWLMAGGDANLTPHQFISFDDIDCERPSGSTTTNLRMEGQCEHVTIKNSRLSGVAGGITGRCFELLRYSGQDARPDNILFLNSTFEAAALAGYIERAEVVAIDTCWIEDVQSGIQVNTSARAVSFRATSFRNAGQINNGTGFAIKVGGSSYAHVHDCFFSGTNDQGVWTDGGHRGLTFSGSNVGLVTKAVTAQATFSSGTSITLYNWRWTLLSCSASLTLQTINSDLAPGESLTFRVHSNATTLATGGNLYLGAGVTSLALAVGDEVTFMRQDNTGLSALQLVASNIQPAVKARTKALPLNDWRQFSAVGLDLPTAPNGTSLGRATATPSPLLGSTTAGDTKTEKTGIIFSMPADYVPGTDITVSIKASGTAASSTLALSAKELGDSGGLNSELCATAAATLTGTLTNYAFTITGSSLTNNNPLFCGLTAVANGASGNGLITITRVRVTYSAL